MSKKFRGVRVVELNPQPGPEEIPGLQVLSTVSCGVVCEVVEIAGPARRIPISTGTVRIRRGGNGLPGLECELLLGPPEKDGDRLSFLNLTHETHVVIAAAVTTGRFAPTPVMSMLNLDPRQHRFSGEYGAIALTGLGSTVELFADAGQWIVVRGYLTALRAVSERIAKTVERARTRLATEQARAGESLAATQANL